MIPDLSAYPLTPPFVEFALPGAGINNRTLGVRSGEGDFVWKVYQTHADPAAIRYEHRLLTWLDQSDLGVSVPAPVPTRNGATLVSTDQGWGALFKFLPGEPPDRERIDHIRAAGDALGQLHGVLTHCPFEARPDFHGYGELRRVHPAIPDPLSLIPADVGLPAMPDLLDLFARWRDDIAELDEFARNVYVYLPWQMTHGDYTPSNTLMLDDRASAVLDFDMAQPDARAIDIAAGLKYSMRIGEQPDPLAFGAAFWQGYTQWVQPSADEIAAIPMLIRLRDAVSALWWLGRGLAAGDVSRGVRRLRDMQITKEWMRENDNEMMRMMR